MSKKLLFYASIFILLILIILFLLFSADKKPEFIKNIPAPTGVNYESDEKQDKANFIVKNFQLLKYGASLPKSVATAENSKLSPAKQYEAYIKDDKLVVLNNTTGIENAVNLSENLLDSNFVFLNDKYLLLIEKDNTFHKLDLFYIVSLESFEKQYFAGSFPIVSRLDLNIEPIVTMDGREVYLKDKSGIYWLLKLTF